MSTQTVQDRVQTLIGAQTVTILTLQAQLEDAMAKISELEASAPKPAKRKGNGAGLVPDAAPPQTENAPPP